MDVLFPLIVSLKFDLEMCKNEYATVYILVSSQAFDIFFLQEDCVRQKNLFDKMRCYVSKYKELQKMEDLEYPIRFVKPLKKSMRRRSHSH